MTLPPGQRRVEGFPRFGTHLHHPPPAVPDDPVIEVSGAGVESFAVPISRLATLPRREITADFHCVAGWSATGLCWGGVPFRAFYRSVVAPALPAGSTVSHVVLAGLDGYRSVASLEDALAEDVLIADRLDGRPLDADHGAPARFLSADQYGFVSTKHLSAIEVRSGEPAEHSGIAARIGQAGLRRLGVERHARARVWHEERHGWLPAWSVRSVYRLLIPPIRALSARGSRRSPELRGDPGQ